VDVSNEFRALDKRVSRATGDHMAKIPAPKPGDDDCVTFAGMVVCPHTAFLTQPQVQAVHRMHDRNVARLKKLKTAAKKKSSKKRKTP